MLKINDIEYKNIDKYINFVPHEGTVDGIKRKRNVLYITFETNDFKLSIETVCDIEQIKELKVNDKKDISKYIIGLPYEDKKGWMYLSDKCNCIIIRTSDNFFELSLKGCFEECDEELKIEYNDILGI